MAIPRLKNYSQPAENNKTPILAILMKLMPTPATVLEIGSGSGQHALHFAGNMPHLTWQPSDQGDYFDGLQDNLAQSGRSNILPPLYLDLDQPRWPLNHADHLFAANVLHIAPAAAIAALFLGAANVISNLVCLYGPFKYDGAFTSESNAQFDEWLKSRDPQSGIRDFEVVVETARQNGFSLRDDHVMPANNQLLVVER